LPLILLIRVTFTSWNIWSQVTRKGVDHQVPLNDYRLQN
jgi:hypothetical protein